MSDSYKDYCEWMEDNAAKQVQIDAFNDLSKSAFSTELDALSKRLECLSLELSQARREIDKTNYGNASEKIDGAINSLSLSKLRVNSMKLMASSDSVQSTSTSQSKLETIIGHLYKVMFFDIDNALQGDLLKKSEVHTKFDQFIASIKSAIMAQDCLSKAL